MRQMERYPLHNKQSAQKLLSICERETRSISNDVLITFFTFFPSHSVQTLLKLVRANSSSLRTNQKPANATRW